MKRKNKKSRKESAEEDIVQEAERNEDELEDTQEQNASFLKRSHTENEDNDSDEDNDSESKPKKKKKKKVPVATGDTDKKKGKKSNRQLKREKYLQRQAEAQAASKDQLKSQCLSYLSQWKHDRSNWKFMKIKQVWLYKNKFSSYLLPDSSWPVLLEYFESAKGNIRSMLLEDANKIISQMDEWQESQNGKRGKDAKEDAELSDTDTNKPDDTTYKRARDIIQCLQE